MKPEKEAPMSEPTTHLPIFVYGTLRTGQSNWARLLRGTTVSETPAVALDHALYANGIAFAHERPGAKRMENAQWTMQNDGKTGRCRGLEHSAFSTLQSPFL
jgi:gamma-glutamylcyclotransferase (GGCT)/AIG2-like uncharacterized protein YtfP